jgi:hypothetical protein
VARPGRAAPVVAAVLFVLAAGIPAFAAKTDIIVLANGDRLTGEVQALRQGKLTLKTDDVGTLSIEWDKIASVTTAAMYDVTLRDGTLLLGRLRPASPRALQVVTSDGTSATVAMDEMVSLATIRTTFLKRIDGSVDLGGSYTQSSGVAELFLDVEGTYRRPAYFYEVTFATNLTRQPEAPETVRHALRVSYTRARTSGWLASSFGLFEHNAELGFNFRGTGALSLGRYVARSNRLEILLAGGLAAGREIPVDHPAATNVDALVIADLSVFTYDYPTTRLDLGVLVFPSLNDPGRVRVNADIKVKREIFRDFFVAASGYDAFDSKPRATGARRNDFGGSLSFGWTF